VNRRDFLLLRTEHATRVAELSCERLYMHYQHASVTTSRAGESALPTALELVEGEPPAEFTEWTTDQLLSDVDRELRRADVLRVLETEWLAVVAFRRDVEALVAAFRDRGGHVEYQASSAATSR
jgi:hypothetical protein